MREALIIVAILLCGCRDAAPEQVVHVYAASSLTDVMEALTDTFAVRENRFRIVLSVAGSSLLARQISLGAQADLFVSAHPIWTDYLLDAGRIAQSDVLPIGNRLVLVSGGDVRTPSASARIAVADPQHVPAGMYARKAMICEGKWDAMKDRIVPTLDVRAALIAVSEGAAEFALVYASDTFLAPRLHVSEAVSPRCRPDVIYTAGVVDSTSVGAARFLRLLQDPGMATVWRSYGFQFLPKG